MTRASFLAVRLVCIVLSLLAISYLGLCRQAYAQQGGGTWVASPSNPVTSSNTGHRKKGESISHTANYSITFTWQSYMGQPPPPTVILREQLGGGGGPFQSGQSGVTTQGTDIIRYSAQEVTGNSFTVSSGSISATATNTMFDGGLAATCTYTVTIYPVTLSVSGTKQIMGGPQVLIGQGIRASLNTPTGFPAVAGTHRWDATGSIFKMFKVETIASMPGQFKGEKVDLTADDKNDPTFRYFCFKEGTTGITCQASVQVPNDSKPPRSPTDYLSVTVKSKNITVVRPLANAECYTGFVAVGRGSFSDPALFAGNTGLDEKSDHGSTWEGTVTTPAEFTDQRGNSPDPDKWHFVQIITEGRWQVLEGQTTETNVTATNTQTGLDGDYAYRQGRKFPAYSGSKLGGFTADGRTYYQGDSPETPLRATQKKVRVDEKFAVYVMYLPPAADSTNDRDWVPLWKITWHWQGTAKKNGTAWDLLALDASDPSIKQAEVKKDSSAASSEFPKWTKVIVTE